MTGKLKTKWLKKKLPKKYQDITPEEFERIRYDFFRDLEKLKEKPGDEIDNLADFLSDRQDDYLLLSAVHENQEKKFEKYMCLL